MMEPKGFSTFMYLTMAGVAIASFTILGIQGKLKPPVRDNSIQELNATKVRECAADLRCASYNAITGEWVWKPGMAPPNPSPPPQEQP